MLLILLISIAMLGQQLRLEMQFVPWNLKSIFDPTLEPYHVGKS